MSLKESGRSFAQTVANSGAHGEKMLANPNSFFISIFPLVGSGVSYKLNLNESKKEVTKPLTSQVDLNRQLSLLSVTENLKPWPNFEAFPYFPFGN